MINDIPLCALYYTAHGPARTSSEGQRELWVQDEHRIHQLVFKRTISRAGYLDTVWCPRWSPFLNRPAITGAAEFTLPTLRTRRRWSWPWRTGWSKETTVLRFTRNPMAPVLFMNGSNNTTLLAEAEDVEAVEDEADAETFVPPPTWRTAGIEGKAEGEEETELKISPRSKPCNLNRNLFRLFNLCFF